LKTKVTSLDPDKVTLENGDVWEANCVLDARGFEPNENVFLGYQKFVGRTIRTKEPHGLKHPIIMDATVEQLGGYRFVYCLPFTEHEILVEDTYYTDGADLSENEVAARVGDYINAKGWGDHELVRQEKGVLPITLASSSFITTDSVIGIRGGFYHAVTGYSFPMALKVAYWIAWDIDCFKTDPSGDIEDHLYYAIQSSQYAHWRKESFLRLLNRMLFRACEPDQRYKVLQRFYGLSQGIVERFYAGQLTWRDKARILIGKPPVPVHKALYNFSERAFIKRERQRRESSE
jgi:lycopene beta-cyclase